MTILKRLLLLCLLLCLTGCGMNSRTLMEQAQWYLGAGEYAAAQAIFQQLGGYENAERYALYAAALEALSQGDTARARADFRHLPGFLSSDLYLEWLDAKELESAGQLEAAREAYLALGSFANAPQAAQRMGEMIPRRDYAAAQTWLSLGNYQRAYEAFTALADYEDSAQQAALCQQKLFEAALAPIQQAMTAGEHLSALAALEAIELPLTELMAAQVNQLTQSCRAALYAQAAALENQGLTGAQEAMTLWTRLGDHEDSAQRLSALAARCQRNLSLKAGHRLQLGGHLWQVLTVADQKALLITERIIAARPLCQPGETFTTYEASSLKTWLEGEFAQCFTPAQRQAMTGPFLPSMEEAALLPSDPDRQATATAEALGQGLRVNARQQGWWWLRDQGELSGCQAIVYFSGAVYPKGVQAHDAQTGVRPALWLDLAAYSLTSGDGTAESPFE